jgi:hypothetical protein
MRIPKLVSFIPLVFVLLFFMNGAADVQADSSQLGTTDNPIEIGPPIVLPHTSPTVSPVLHNQSFDNAHPPVQTTVTLPSGHWGKVIFTITGTQQGRQYDRLLLAWAGNTQIFAGVTPEPTAAGINWKVQKDVTAYLPLLTGKQVITTGLDNYVNATYTGIPVISTELDFYPQASYAAQTQNLWELPASDSIIPLNSHPSMSTVQTKGTLTSSVKLPHDIVGAYLDLYAIGQSNDEFWWSNQPAFREVEISIDGKPAGVVWPFPVIYTGGVNPYLWQPITAIHTLDLPAYRLDLTPFAGLLGGEHTMSIQVANNQGYWLLNGSLFLYEDGGKPTSGTITTDTLTFPTQAPTTKTSILNATSDTLLNEEAASSYEIQGSIRNGSDNWTTTVSSSLKVSNDQTNVSSGNWQLVHGLQDVTTDETLTARGLTSWQRHSDTSYTLDAGSAYMQPTGNSSAFFLPANLTQSLDEIHSISGPGLNASYHRNGAIVNVPYHSSLYETTQGYAALQRGIGADIANGATTAFANFEDSSGRNFHQVLAARGGVVTLKQVTDTY